MNSNLDENFTNLKLEKPLFFNCPVGLRFEIGPDEIEVWKDSKVYRYNEEYFDVSLKQAISIFESVFSSKDNIEIIYQQYSDGRQKIRKGSFIFKQVNSASLNSIIKSDVRDIYELDYKSECWKRVSISGLSIEDINYKNILLSLINTDFGDRNPSMLGECFFINHSKDIILNLYDNRGMDVISSKKEALMPLYKSHNDWLLNCNREKMDSVFS